MRSFLFFALTALMASEESLRFTNVYKQGYDSSCGIAVTASLLNHYWNIPIAEADLYRAMILDRVSEDAAGYTISFLDIMNYVQGHGIAGKAYKMDWAALEDTLLKGYAPVIINYDKPDPHFALLVWMHDGYAYMADPARGFEAVARGEFEGNYSGNALLTASRRAEKDAGRLQRIVEDETTRLETLQSLARSRRRW